MAGKDLRVGLVEHNEDVGVAVLEVPLRLRLVVQAQDRRRRAATEDHAAGLESGGEGREAEGATPLRRRQGVDAQAGFGDDAERSLAADEELSQVRPGGGPGPLPSVCTTRPSASTTSRPMTMSSIFP